LHAIVQFLKSSFNCDLAIRPLLPIVAATLEPLDFLFTLLVVNLPLGLIAEYFVGTRNLCKLAGCLFIARVLVWVIEQTLLAVSTLDFRFRGVARNIE
jgi:uncharacterized membrane-anchored protein YitT (DUF2179 family)